MPLTLNQKVNVYNSRPLDNPGQTAVEKVDFLIKANAENIAQGKANFATDKQRTKLWIANRIWQRDRLPVIAALDSVASVESTTDAELESATVDVMKDLYLNYKYDSQINAMPGI